MRRWIFWLPVLFVASSTTRLEAASFVGLSDLIGGWAWSRASAVSDDGTIVVGGSDTDPDWVAFRWIRDQGPMRALGHRGEIAYDMADPADVSRDGFVVVGQMGDWGGPFEAFRWDSTARTYIGLGDLPDGVFGSQANAVSADGTIIVGQGTSALGEEAFRWTAEDGMVGLGDLGDGQFGSSANDISADKSVIVGMGHSASGAEAFRMVTGSPMAGLGDLPGGMFESCATAVSADGSVVVGYSISESGTEAFRWTAEQGMVGLGDLPGNTFFSKALAVSADGSIVVGTSHSETSYPYDDDYEAFIWTEADGMRSLREVLVEDCGLDLGNWELLDAKAMSPDGRFIVGCGNGPDLGFGVGLRRQAFVADLQSIPEPTILAMALGGSALLLLGRQCSASVR